MNLLNANKIKKTALNEVLFFTIKIFKALIHQPQNLPTG
jgi:hypothetical protein